MTRNKYLAIAATSARQRLRDRGELFGRMGFYALLLFVFSRLWEVVLSHERAPLGAGQGAHNFVWYLAVTEWIVLSLPPLHFDVEADVRDGSVAYHLTRPTPYPALKLAEASGDLLVRLVSVGATGFCLALALTGELPISALEFAVLVPLVVLAAELSLVVMFAIGLSTFWLHDCRPLYWMWQKLAFVLGGLMVPLTLYPSWLQTIAGLTPFAAMLHGPGQVVLGASVGASALVFAQLLVWLLIAAGVTAAAYRRALSRVCIGGG